MQVFLRSDASLGSIIGGLVPSTSLLFEWFPQLLVVWISLIPLVEEMQVRHDTCGSAQRLVLERVFLP